MKTGHPSSTSMSLHLLGFFALNAQEERPLPELRRKTGALLAYLAVAQRPYSRHELAALFCQEANDPIRALRHMLSRLRAVVGSQILQEANKAIGLDTAHIWVDDTHFTRWPSSSFSACYGRSCQFVIKFPTWAITCIRPRMATPYLLGRSCENWPALLVCPMNCCARQSA